MENENGFIVNGKKYCPNKSFLLCSYSEGLLSTISLYISPKGAFFTVEETGFMDSPKFALIDRAAALEFMNTYPEGIEEEAYISVFGKPEEG